MNNIHILSGKQVIRNTQTQQTEVAGEILHQILRTNLQWNV